MNYDTALLIIIRHYLRCRHKWLFLFWVIDLCLKGGCRLSPSFTHSDVNFSLLSLYSAFVLSSMSHFIVPHPLRHTNNNYFLNAYRHIWLEIMHENTDYDSLLSMLTVMLCCANVATVWPCISFSTTPRSPPGMVYARDLTPITIFLLVFSTGPQLYSNAVIWIQNKCF